MFHTGVRILFLCVLLSACTSFPVKKELSVPQKAYTLRPNENFKGPGAETIEEVFLLPDEEIDLATAVLLITKEAYEDLYEKEIDIHDYRRKIDERVLKISREIAGERGAVEIISTINRHFFHEERFFSYDSVLQNPQAMFVNYLLDQKKGNCLSLSLLYLSVAERIGLPLYGVVAPNHFFVRYDDGKNHMNIETTEKGRIHADNYYRTQYNIYGDTPFLVNLKKKETIAVFLSNVGNSYAEEGMLDKALVLYERALTLYPQNPENHSRLGTAYADKGIIDRAVIELEKAIALNENDYVAYSNLGVVYNRMGLWDKAIAVLKKSLSLNSDNARAHNALGTAYMERGFIDRAIAAYKKALHLEPDSELFRNNIRSAYARKQMREKAKPGQ